MIEQLTMENLKSYEYLPGGVLVYGVGEVGKKMKIYYANSEAWKFFGCHSWEEFEEYSGGDFQKLICEDDQAELTRLMRISKGNQISKKHRIQYHVITKKGQIHLIDDYGDVVELNPFGEAVLCFFKKAQEDIRPAADYHDRLTHLLSMSKFLSLADELLQRAEKKSAQRYHFAYFNICNFKEYNVQNGTQMGDRVLIAAAEVIKKYASTELVSRFSGDHFVAITDADDFQKRGERIIEEFQDLFFENGLSMKIGLYPIKKKGERASVACDLAKAACDSIRSSSANIRIFDEKLREKMELGNYIRRSIDQAIKKHYIRVYYQPVVRTLSGATCGMEALARWIDPVHGFLSPADFIPVLEEHHLIHKLDLYMVREICREMSEMEERGLALLPVSFNLSRQDFMECDIFEEIEQIVKEYHVARDFLNVEITESMVMENPELLKREIKRFRDVGYQVWMDDFGSGYSSLNVLKDFEFDEIKLDMVFLSSFTSRSRKIVRSIMEMAKELGVQTVAEGVETKEQFTYLKEIGCEKIQGYLIGKPAPRDGLIADEAIFYKKMEERAFRSYYDQIGAVNFISDKAFALSEYDGQNFNNIYSSPSYLRVWEMAGAAGEEAILELSNSAASPLSRLFREYQLVVQASRDFVDMDYSVNGQYIHMRAKCIARHEDRFCYFIEVSNVAVTNPIEEQRDKLDRALRVMQSMYDSIYLMNVRQNRLESLLPSSYSNLPEYQEMLNTDLTKVRYAVAEHFIYPQERKKFLEFADPDTLEERLLKEKRGQLTRYFRTRTSNGAYVWKRHNLIYIPVNDIAIYTTEYAALEQNGLLERLSTGVRNNSMDYLMFQGLMESKAINFFWKDKNRRFIGANQKFLDTYSFTDLSDILGKTDEDMHWHIDDEPFKQIEENIIKTGCAVRNEQGKNIIKGFAHNIMATKEPLYQNGEIIGLFGYFVDLDDLPENTDADSIRFVDPLSGLMSAQGFMNVIPDYVDGFEARNENFAMVRFEFPEYTRVRDTYGENAVSAAYAKIGSIIAEETRNQAVCARLFAANFVIVTRLFGEELHEVIDRITARTHEIHEIDEYKITLNPIIRISYANQAENVRELFDFISIPEASGKLTEAQKRVVTEEILKNIPGAVAVFSVTGKEEIKQIFVSDKAREVLGIDRMDMEDAVFSSEHVYPEDYEQIKTAALYSARKKLPFDEFYRVKTDVGTIKWIHLVAEPVKQKNGTYLFYGLYTDVTAVKEAEELRDQQYKERVVRYQEILSSIEEEDDEDLVAKVHADMTDNVILDAWVGKEAYQVNLSSSFESFSYDVMRHAYSNVDRDRLRKEFQVEQIKKQLKIQGHATASVDYLRYAPGGQVFWSRIECRALIDPETEHSICYVFVYNIAKDQVPPLFLQNVVKHDLEKLSIFNLKEETIQTYHFVKGGEIIVGDAKNYEDSCIEYANAHIDQALRKKYQWSMDIHNVTMEMETSEEGVYKCSFWTNYDGRKRRKTWSFSFANEEHTSVMISRADITESYLDRSEFQNRITEVTKELEELKRDVTGVLSRKAAIEEMRSQIDAEKEGRYTLIMIDLDNLKTINDTFGHPTGDLAIGGIAKTLLNNFRSTDVIGRIGGDEFMVWLDGISDELLKEKVEDIIRQVNQIVVDEESGRTLCCSIGCLSASYGKYSFEEAYELTDKALYLAKKKGKNQAVYA